jgi:threonyl-tRNA synthetase
MKEAQGEAAFYGPKIDIMAVDALGRQWQISTVQLDFSMPERFDLFCINEEGQKERVVMIHRALIGSPDRFLGILIEHFGGHFPLWLAPEQVRIIPVTDVHLDYARTVLAQLKDAGLRAELDDSNESMGKKIRGAKTERAPYFLVIGDQEVAAGTVTVEHNVKGKIGVMPVADFVASAVKEVKERAR